MFTGYVPVFNSGRARLYVHVSVPAESSASGWGDPRAAQVEDLVRAIKQLTPEQQAYVATNLGLVQEAIGERLEAAEAVLEAVEDAKLGMNRLAAYREKYPAKQEELEPHF